MIADLKPYPDYKESGLPWLGKVPGHWETRRLKQIARLAYGNSLPRTGRTQGTVPVFGSNGRVGWHSDSNTMAPCIIVGRKGSFGKINFCKDAAFVIDTAFFIDHRISKADIRWLYYTLGWIRLDGVSKDSAIPGLDREDAYQQVAALPPLTEQAAIVRFLDWANGRLERAIRAKRKVIALLTEQKQAIIHRAVTRGLDPSVPLKPSGIPWLGDIPQHWEVLRIKYLLREVDERSTTGTEHLLSLRMHHGLVLFADHFTRPPQAATLVGFKIVRPGQFVVNRMQAGNGVIYASTLTGLVSPDYAVFNPIGDTNVEFLGELFRSRRVRAKFRAESKGLGTGTSGFLRLYNDRLGAIHVALPPLVEQRDILTGLARELSVVNTVISRLEREIELLREYRTRLVADVVTGKLDVREAAARLPEEAGYVGLSDLSDESDLSDLSGVSDGAGEPLPEEES